MLNLRYRLNLINVNLNFCEWKESIAEKLKSMKSSTKIQSETEAEGQKRNKSDTGQHFQFLWCFVIFFETPSYFVMGCCWSGSMFDLCPPLTWAFRPPAQVSRRGAGGGGYEGGVHHHWVPQESGCRLPGTNTFQLFSSKQELYPFLKQANIFHPIFLNKYILLLVFICLGSLNRFEI